MIQIPVAPVRAHGLNHQAVPSPSSMPSHTPNCPCATMSLIFYTDWKTSKQKKGQCKGVGIKAHCCSEMHPAPLMSRSQFGQSQYKASNEKRRSCSLWGFVEATCPVETGFWIRQTWENDNCFLLAEQPRAGYLTSLSSNSLTRKMAEIIPLS